MCPFAKIKQNTRDAVPCQTGIRTRTCSIHATALRAKSDFRCHVLQFALNARLSPVGADVETAI
jgi:hypothetical protein